MKYFSNYCFVIEIVPVWTWRVNWSSIWDVREEIVKNKTNKKLSVKYFSKYFFVIKRLPVWTLPINRSSTGDQYEKRSLKINGNNNFQLNISQNIALLSKYFHLSDHMSLLIQVNLDMTDHCMTDFCIWRTICLVPIRCISSICHMYTTDFAYDGTIFLDHWVRYIQVHLYTSDVRFDLLKMALSRQ